MDDKLPGWSHSDGRGSAGEQNFQCIGVHVNIEIIAELAQGFEGNLQ